MFDDAYIKAVLAQTRASREQKEFIIQLGVRTELL